MLANFFNKSKPINFLVLLALLISYYVIIPSSTFVETRFSINTVFEKTGFLFLIVILLISYQIIIFKNKLTSDASFSLLIFISLLGISLNTHFKISILLPNILLLLIYHEIYGLGNSNEGIKKIFNASFFIGVLYIFSPFYILFSLLLLSAIVAFNSLTYRIILIVLTGLSVPIFLYFTYCFSTNMMQDFWVLFYWYAAHQFGVFQDWSLLISFLFFGVLTLLGLIKKKSSNIRLTISYKKNRTLLIIHLITCLLFLLFKDPKHAQTLLILFYPVTIVVGNYLYLLKNTFYKNILLVLILVFPFLLYFIG